MVIYRILVSELSLWDISPFGDIGWRASFIAVGGTVNTKDNT